MFDLQFRQEKPWDQRAKDVLAALGEALAKARSAPRPPRRAPSHPEEVDPYNPGEQRGNGAPNSERRTLNWAAGRNVQAEALTRAKKATMNALLATDDEALGAEVRKVLLREGLDCPASNVVRLDLAPEHLARSPADLFVVVLPADPEGALRRSSCWSGCRGKTSTRVLAVGPAADPKLVLRALRGAVDDYLDQNDLEAELEAALARWRTLQPSREEAGRVIAVLAPSGGSGSSTLAVNLATVLAKEHKSALLLDLKLETGDLAALLDLKPTHSLADLCLNVSRMDRVLFERSLARHASGVHLLAPPAHLTRRRARHARGDPQGPQPGPHHLSRTCWSTSITTSIPSRSTCCARPTSSCWSSGSTSPRCGTPGGPWNTSSAWVSTATACGWWSIATASPRKCPIAKAEEALGLKIFHYVPDDPKSVNRANNNGVPVVTESPSTRVAKSVTKLAISVNGRHQEPAARADGSAVNGQGGPNFQDPRSR